MPESYMGRITEKEFSKCPKYAFYIDPFGIIQMIAIFCYIKFYVIFYWKVYSDITEKRTFFGRNKVIGFLKIYISNLEFITFL